MTQTYEQRVEIPQQVHFCRIKAKHLQMITVSIIRSQDYICSFSVLNDFYVPSLEEYFNATMFNPDLELYE